MILTIMGITSYPTIVIPSNPALEWPSQESSCVIQVGSSTEDIKELKKLSPFLTSADNLKVLTPEISTVEFPIQLAYRCVSSKLITNMQSCLQPWLSGRDTQITRLKIRLHQRFFNRSFTSYEFRPITLPKMSNIDLSFKINN